MYCTERVSTAHKSDKGDQSPHQLDEAEEEGEGWYKNDERDPKRARVSLPSEDACAPPKHPPAEIHS